MKSVLFLSTFLLIPYFALTATNDYDYSSYTATSKNENLSGDNIECTTSDTSAVYITKTGITISDSSITKSGDYTGSNTDDCEFYGINAAILVNGGDLQ